MYWRPLTGPPTRIGERSRYLRRTSLPFGTVTSLAGRVLLGDARTGDGAGNDRGPASEGSGRDGVVDASGRLVLSVWRC